MTGSFGITLLVETDREFCVQRHIGILKHIDDVLPAYLRVALRSPSAIDFAAARATGTAQKTVSLSALRSIPIPLPPLAEQHRIVARVDELMGLLDRLEAARGARDGTRAALRDAALAALRDAEDADAVKAAWTRIADHMDDLFTDPADVAPLRQTILQLAVRGRLVPQDPADEPASKILERMADERERLASITKRRKSKALPPFEAGDEPFEPPTGWEVARVESVCDIGSGVTKGRKLAGRETVVLPYLRVANVQAGYLSLDVIKEIEVPEEEIAKYEIRAGDVLMTEGGDWDKLGRSAIWGGEIEVCLHQNHIFRVRPLTADLSPRWLSMYTNSPDGRGYFQSCAKQTTNLASINKTQLRACVLPIPPCAEQVRILNVLDSIMGLCDELETRLAKASTTRAAFAAAAVHHLDAA